MLELFGSLSASMVSLYFAVTGNAEWEEYYKLSILQGDLYAFSFLFATAFFQLVIFNVLTGLFVENVTNMARPDKEQIALVWRQQRLTEQSQVKGLCEAIDLDGNGRVSWGEFLKHATDARIVAYFASLQLDIKDAEMFFKILEHLNDGENCDSGVPIEAFVDGCMRMKGAASSIDLHIVSVQLNMSQRQQASILGELMEQHRIHGEEMHLLRSMLEEMHVVHAAASMATTATTCSHPNPLAL